MKINILLFTVFITFQFAPAQSELAAVEKPLQNYMEGSSYNKPELLESAFTENATLYLTGRDGEFKLYSPKEYVSFFKNAAKGTFNGRYAKVLGIEVSKDIATAKVEISFPEKNMLYIDLFLLKKFDAGWKIISKTATRTDDNDQKEEKTEINSPVIRLTILNDKNEILIRKTKYGWMTPAHRFYSKQNINRVLDSMATNYGVTIKDIELAGMFTYKYTFKDKADTRQFYVAKYKSGTIKSIKDEDLFWLPKDEAIKKLDSTVSSLGLMTNQILEYPNTLWGGSFILDKVDGKLQSKVEEKFYPLRKEL
ncbi:nuclear transport factor 2 family protein [Aureibaculum luteum]|uniref:nuclear transport factor 2 family protein n=1 Tax=Aureibaculum luteum TaxID=1548456 RepID=UPI000E4E4FFE|nr:nuclear transport factor 2 family protein [Aureibaculum luteum]